jgi:hypothetical protein
MEIDEAGCDHQPARVEHALRVRGPHAADRCDLPVTNGHVRAVALRPRPVHDDAVLQEKIVVCHAGSIGTVAACAQFLFG